MTEDEARAWAAARFDSAAMDRLDRLAAIVAEESERQNLIERSTLDQIWARHIVDSLQLVALGPEGPWLDIGTGAGFPGLAVASVEPERAMSMVEPRRLRADYLRKAGKTL
ncbi:MAG: rsmG, partial [Sphingomonas bacterium]|nr:rsmG [Sphingomonas bacterium]